MLLKHYAPRAKMRINVTNLLPNEIGLGFGKCILGDNAFNLSSNADIDECAMKFYPMLRAIDKVVLNSSYDTIAVAPIPDCGIGAAINDKLRRGSFVG